MKKIPSQKPLAVEYKEGEEMIKKTEIKNSPFMVISVDGKHFGVLGKYRLTEIHKTFKEAELDTKQMTWNRIIQVISLVYEIHYESKNPLKKK